MRPMPTSTMCRCAERCGIAPMGCPPRREPLRARVPCRQLYEVSTSAGRSITTGLISQRIRIPLFPECRLMATPHIGPKNGNVTCLKLGDAPSRVRISGGWRVSECGNGRQDGVNEIVGIRCCVLMTGGFQNLVDGGSLARTPKQTCRQKVCLSKRA